MGIQQILATFPFESHKQNEKTKKQVRNNQQEMTF